MVGGGGEGCQAQRDWEGSHSLCVCKLIVHCAEERRANEECKLASSGESSQIKLRLLASVCDDPCPLSALPPFSLAPGRRRGLLAESLPAGELIAFRQGLRLTRMGLESLPNFIIPARESGKQWKIESSCDYCSSRRRSLHPAVSPS